MSEFDRERQTTHKIRADWFQDRTSYPKREQYPPDLDRARRTQGPVWTEIGPTDIGGRITSMVIDPRDPDHIYLGSAGGGVWETGDAGKTWKQAWHDQENSLIIGSLAADPSKPDVLYAGTGEANLSADNYPGCGLFRTADGGKNWDKAGWVQDSESPLPNGEQGTFLVLGIPRRIGTIAVDPFDSKHILIGGVTHSEEETGGLFETHDGGTTWDPAINTANPEQFSRRFTAKPTGVFISGVSYFCHCVVFHPTVQGLVFATVEARGVQSGIWISRDGAQSWVQAKGKNLPAGDQFGRTSIACAPNSKTVWALAGQQGTQNLLGVFRSDDLGATWMRCAGGGFAADGQLSYTNCIAADPANPMTAVVGSLDLYRTPDGGNHWEQVSDGKLRNLSVHNDHHVVAILGTRIYSANDGGFAISEDNGATWETRNTGLACTMIYGLDVAPTNPHCMAIGTQDNGVWARGLPKLGDVEVDASDAFRRVVTGDGGFVRYDPLDATRLYASIQRMQIWHHATPGGFQAVLPSESKAEQDIPDAERRRVWQCVLATAPGPLNKPAEKRAVYAGSDRLWKSKNEGKDWEAISDSFDGSIISALEIAPGKPGVIFVGTTNGGFFRTTNAGKNWSRNLAGPLSPGRLITRIATDPLNAKDVCYTIGMVAATSSLTTPFASRSARVRRGEGSFSRFIDGESVIFEFAHHYRSKDGGDNWSSGDDGLPNLPAGAVEILPGAAAMLVAHDGGVAALQTGQVFDISGNVPNVRVTDLVLRIIPGVDALVDGQIYISTYGRGVWSVGLESVRKWIAQEMAAHH